MPYLVPIVIVVSLGLAAVGVIPRYKRDIRAAQNRVDSLASHTVRSAAGPVEYLDFGEGPCLR